MNAWELGACQEPPSSRARSANAEIRYRWPNKKVPYVITNDFSKYSYNSFQFSIINICPLIRNSCSTNRYHTRSLQSFPYIHMCTFRS